MAHNWYSYSNLERYAKLLLQFRRKFPGRGYVYLARTGFAISALAIGAVIPGVRDLFVALVVGLLKRIELFDAERDQRELQIADGVPELIIVSAFFLGILIIILSLYWYHQFLYREPTGKVNDGAISLNIPQGKNPFILIKQVARQTSNIIDLEIKAYENSNFGMLEGPLFAPNFSIFLEKVAQRTMPQNLFKYTIDGDVYRIQKAGKT